MQVSKAMSKHAHDVSKIRNKHAHDVSKAMNKHAHDVSKIRNKCKLHQVFYCSLYKNNYTNSPAKIDFQLTIFLKMQSEGTHFI